MTPAEIRSIRESLGLSHAELAAVLSVDLRSVRRWEAGQHAIHDDNAEAIRKIVEITGTAIRQRVINLRRKPHPTMIVYRFDEDMWAAHPDWAPLPVRWHRTVAARVAELVPGLKITYPPDLRGSAENRLVG